MAAKSEDGAEQAEIAAAYSAYAGPLYRYLRTILQSAEEAEDILQETFIDSLKQIRRIGIHNLRAYLFQAAKNKALMVLRTSRRRNVDVNTDSLSWIDASACSGEDREAEIDLSRALQKLPLEQKEVLVLKLSEGLTFKEIGETLNISQNTAASRYRLGLARLRALLEGGDEHG